MPIRQASHYSLLSCCLIVSGLFIGLWLGGCGSSESQQPEAEAGASVDTAALARADSLGQVATSDQPVILVLGNSIAAGYGLELEQAFPHLLQQRIDSLGMDYQVVNAGLSGETTTAGLNRLPWLLRQPVAVLIIELGGNDGLRGIPPAETRKNFRKMVELAREKYPDIEVILTGMQAPPNMGPDYTEDFARVFPEVAQAMDTHFVSFLLEGVAGEPELNQDDGIHPTPEGQRIVADNVWQVLEPVIRAEG